MAIAEVASKRAESGSNAAANTDILAFPGGGVTAGDFLVVGGAMWGATTPTGITITDTLGTNYSTGTGATVLGTAPAGVTWRTFLAYGFAPTTGANSVTANPSGAANDFSFGIDAFTGVDATTPADVNGGTSTDVTISSTTPLDSITTIAANALIIGVMSVENAGTTFTAGASYTLISENESGSGNQGHSFVFRLVTTAQAYSVDWTIGQASIWAAQTHSFKPSSAAAAHIKRMMMLGVG